MKKFICGFVLGALIFSMLGVVAVSYVANPLEYKVLVNGKEFTSDPPPLEVDGRTYLPLRAMGDALGVPVNWNEELRQAEVGESTYYEKKEDVYYEESWEIVDIGKKYGINFVKVEKEKDTDGTELINYYYNCTDIDPYFSDYIDFLKESGYQISKGKKTTSFPVSEEWYIVSEKNNKKAPFACGVVSDLEKLEVYFVITFVKS